jgi:hypothetical protein
LVSSQRSPAVKSSAWHGVLSASVARVVLARESIIDRPIFDLMNVNLVVYIDAVKLSVLDLECVTGCRISVVHFGVSACSVHLAARRQAR